MVRGEAGLSISSRNPKAMQWILRLRFAPLRMTEEKMYPEKLNKIINLVESLPEDERRETLVSYADSAKKQEPREGEKFDLEDIRKDEECTDKVGVYLQVDDQGKAHLRMTLGPEVQTLTRAMTAILCKGLDGATPQEILDLPSDFVTRIVGAELVRIRSQTTYYVLTRIKSICKVYLDRQRVAQAQVA
jgi:cysteine desulfuration protein SufE